jgi:hypothetical protein
LLGVVTSCHISIIPEIANASSGFPGCGKRRSGGFSPPGGEINSPLHFVEAALRRHMRVAMIEVVAT